MTPKERDEAKKHIKLLDEHITRIKEKNLDKLSPDEVAKVKKYLDKLTTVRDRIVQKMAMMSAS